MGRLLFARQVPFVVGGRPLIGRMAAFVSTPRHFSAPIPESRSRSRRRRYRCCFMLPQAVQKRQPTDEASPISRRFRFKSVKTLSCPDTLRPRALSRFRSQLCHSPPVHLNTSPKSYQTPVIGSTFSKELLLHMLPNNSRYRMENLHGALLKLIEANFISRSVVGKTEHFSFVHNSVQEV